MSLPPELMKTLEDLDPDNNPVGYERHSDEAYTLMLRGRDHTWTFWRACLSLDGRWTVSPIY